MKDTKAELFYPFWTVAIALCMVVALFALVFASCADGSTKPDETGKTVAEETDTKNTTESSNQDAIDATQSGTDSKSDTSSEGTQNTDDAKGSARLTETEDMGQSYIDSFKFLGDSTTNGLAHYEIVPSTQVWTPLSGTLTLPRWNTDTIVDRESDNEEILIVDAMKAHTPEYLLITLGVNGISFLDKEGFKESYTNLVNTVKEKSPNTKIILNSIYPVSASYDTSSGISNEKIDAANVWVEEVANETGLKYLDSASALKDADGALPDKYGNNDGLHLGPDGYNVVIDYIRTHGFQ